MKATIRNYFNVFAASTLLAMSAGATAASGAQDAPQWKGDLQYSVYHIAAQYEAERASSNAGAGQAGRAGPTDIPAAHGRIDAASPWTGDLRYSVYHIAAEYDAAKKAGTLSMGQAGRAGPDAVPGGRVQAADVSDIRFSIYDQSGRTSW